MATRRDFLAHCATAATATLLPAQALSAESAPVSKQAFTRLVGQPIRCIGDAAEAFTLKLSEILDGPADRREEQFSLVLEDLDRTGPRREGGLFHLHHPAIGLLLVRLEPSDTRAGVYVSDFSILT